jgi:hypothetical protein
MNYNLIENQKEPTRFLVKEVRAENLARALM